MPLTAAWPTHFTIPQRLILSIFGFLAIVNAYTMRLCLDIALTEFLLKQSDSSSVSRQTFKKQRVAIKSGPLTGLSEWLNAKNVTEPKDNTENLSSAHWRNAILVSFYIGYAISQVPGGLLADKYGGKWILAASIATAAIFTILTPVAVEFGGPLALLIVRVIIGLSEGPMFPALSALLAHWVPAQERGKLAVLVLSGTQVGIFWARFMSSAILGRFRWTLVFYFFGSCALMWCICFAYLCYNDPASNPFIDETEKQYLQQKIIAATPKIDLSPTPWKNIFKSMPVWAFISATMQHDWTQNQMVSDVSKYIKGVEKDTNPEQITFNKSVHTNLYASIPFMLNWLVSLISGIISDVLVNRDLLTTTVTRRVMAMISALGPNLFTEIISCFTCSEKKDAAALFNCAVAIMGTYYAGSRLTPLDMSPNYAGTLMGIANGIGSLTGAIATYLNDIESKHTELRKPPFNRVRSLLMLVSTALLSAEVQDFNNPDGTIHKID